MLGFPASIGNALAATRRHIVLILFFVAIIAVVLLGRAWLAARDARAQLSATLAVQQRAIADANAREAARDAQLRQSLAQITAAKKNVRTPSQAATALMKSLPQLIESSTGAPLPVPLTIGAEVPDSPRKSADASAGATGEELSSSSALNSGTAAAGNQVRESQQGSEVSAGKPQGSTRESGNNSSSPASPQSSPAGAQANRPGASASGAHNSVGGSTGSVSPSQPPSAGAQANRPGNAAPSAQNSVGGSTGSVSSPQPPSAGAQANRPGNAAQPALLIPPEDLKPLFDTVQECLACRAQLTAAQGTLADERTKVTALTVERDAIAAQRDAALRASRGTFWSRTRRAAKWFLLGAAAGAAAGALAAQGH